MIDSVLTFTLRVASARGQGKIDVFQTVFVNGRTATATIALSAFTNGEEDGHMGAATAIITKAGVVTAPGRTDTLPLDPIDPNRNQIRIPNCSFITFRMGVQMAEAIAVASVFVEGGAIKLSTRSYSAWMFEKGTGRVTGFHKVAFPAGARLPSTSLVLRRVRECAAQAFDVDVRSVGAVAVTRPPAVVKAGLVVNPSSGRVSREMRERRPRAMTVESVLRSG